MSIEKEGEFLVDDQYRGVILLQTEEADVAHCQTRHQQSFLQT